MRSPMFDQSSNRNSVLQSEAALRPSTTPPEVVGRERELATIADTLRPLAHGARPDHLLVSGPAGVGKTTCIKHVFEKLDDQANVKTVYINCWQYNTRPSLLTELLIQLGYPAPRKGKPVDELLSKLREWMDKNRGFAVALDEFDQLEDKTEIVYDLQMVNSEAENKLGVVMVSNQHPSQFQLDSRSRSRLNCQTVEFQSYSTQQLVEILEERVEQAFRSGAVSDDVLELIAERVAEQNGDCREALNLLLRAGRKADQEDASELTADVVETMTDSV